MKKLLSMLLMSCLAGSGFTQSLQDQISAVNQVQNERKAAERAAAEREAAAERARQVEAERRQASREAHERQLAADRRVQAEKEVARQAEIEKAKLAEEKADKSRDQSYEDELRQLEIEERKIALSEKRAKAERANDYIDHELKQQAAQTDVIQSNADATRNVSQGAKDLLTSEGKAREEEASKIFR